MERPTSDPELSCNVTGDFLRFLMESSSLVWGGKVVVWEGAEAVRGGAGARCCGLGGVRRGVLGREVVAQEEGSLPSALIVVIVGG